MKSLTLLPFYRKLQLVRPSASIANMKTMNDILGPLKTESLVEVFVQRFEKLILSGKLTIGQKLPSERELALQLEVSRPVVHEGLVELEHRGLVIMHPRIGTIVSDYRRNGSLTLLNSLVNYHIGALEPSIFESLLELRKLFEIENARLAAERRNDAHMAEFRKLLELEAASDPVQTSQITDLDFSFHHLIAIVSGNMIYPLLINSFREVYTNLTSLFFQDAGVVSSVFAFHIAFVEAIDRQNVKKAQMVMQQILEHGESRLRSMFNA